MVDDDVVVEDIEKKEVTESPGPVSKKAAEALARQDVEEEDAGEDQEIPVEVLTVDE